MALNEILSVFRSYFGEIKVDYKDIRKGDIRNSESNPNALKQLHNNKLRLTSLEEGLFTTFDWFKEHYSF